MSEKNSIVFFGSGPVAAESLRLLANTFSIEAIITKPTTEREMLVACPGAPIYLVNNRTELDVLIESNTFSSSCGVLIDFGIIVSQKVIDYFKYGIINSHFSLLPELRGADPISFAILEGREKTGVSLMLLVKAMDEGPILSIGEVIIDSNDTTPRLTEKLIKRSYSLLEHSIPKYLAGEIVATDQNNISEQYSRQVSYTRKLTKADGALDWNKPADILEREIRAFVQWPKSYTSLNKIDIVITEATVIDEMNGKAGNMFQPDKHSLAITTADKSLKLIRVKPSGKAEMNIQAFLAGYKSKLGL